MTRQLSRADEYLICKVRGHEADYGDEVKFIPGKDTCVYCGTIFWEERVLHEEGAPEPTKVPGKPENGYWHAVDCDKKGTVNVYHFSDCEGGEKCALFQYLSKPGGMEKHIKRGNEYTVTKNKTGGFVFKISGKVEGNRSLKRRVEESD